MNNTQSFVALFGLVIRSYLNDFTNGYENKLQSGYSFCLVRKSIQVLQMSWTTCPFALKKLLLNKLMLRTSLPVEF